MAEDLPAISVALIPLPRFYNDDEYGKRGLVEDWKFEQTAREIAQKFGGGTLFMFPLEESPRGYWWNEGYVEKDVLALLEVDIEDTPENHRWLESYSKDVLLDRFQQKAIYIVFVGPVDRMTVRRREIGLGNDPWAG